MASIQIESIEEPFSTDRDLTNQAFRLLLRAQFVGCLPGDDVTALGPKAMRSVGLCMNRRKLPTNRWAFLLAGSEKDLSPSRWLEALSAMNDQIEMSPLPDGEWTPVVDALGEDLVADVLGISVSSVRRYLAKSRPTPQAVAERLHFIALLLADLAGSYNEYGLRRWFRRQRDALGGRRPVELLGVDFDPDGTDADALRSLAASLAGAVAA